MACYLGPYLNKGAILALTWIKEQRRNSSITDHLNKVLPKSTKQRSTVNEYMCFITLLYPQSHSDDSQYICHATARLSLQSAIQRCSLASWTAHRLCENKQPPLECSRATANCYQRTSEARWSRTSKITHALSMTCSPCVIIYKNCINI